MSSRREAIIHKIAKKYPGLQKERVHGLLEFFEGVILDELKNGHKVTLKHNGFTAITMSVSAIPPRTISGIACCIEAGTSWRVNSKTSKVFQRLMHEAKNTNSIE